jgi:hydroxymethylpyrimidine pyrophosphatase-like HAD family hydrolase
MNRPVYIFDVDGVINDVHTYSVDSRVLEQIDNLLNQGCYVALNTGRGYELVEEEIINYLRNRPGAHDKLNRVFVAVEMGGLTVSFVDGTEHREPNASSLLPSQIERVKQLYEQYKVNGVMRWYTGKLSMATIHKPADVDPKRFLAEGKPLVVALEKEFSGEDIKIKHNPDAIDITTLEAGKWTGTQLIYDWLRRVSAAQFTHFICFGDNTSDYEMARFLGRQGHAVDFVFTGKNLDDFEHDSNVTLIRTDGLYNESTYTFLRHNPIKQMSF